jgi:hypothetical protein
LTAAFVLAPATRWGYFVYPAGIGCWLLLSGDSYGTLTPDTSYSTVTSGI